MHKSYDFHAGERGRYSKRYAAGSNIVVLDADVAAVFPDAESVNRALRACGEIVRLSSRRVGRRA
ncbi:hypothetical protein RAS1_34330 [Phycisphaerae bacterium RAS1]|nr:hypothetical protein RAS1_34330 [Phycisphaerae bacterium RAS1]